MLQSIVCILLILTIAGTLWLHTKIVNLKLDMSKSQRETLGLLQHVSLQLQKCHQHRACQADIDDKKAQGLVAEEESCGIQARMRSEDTDELRAQESINRPEPTTGEMVVQNFTLSAKAAESEKAPAARESEQMSKLEPQGPRTKSSAVAQSKKPKTKARAHAAPQDVSLESLDAQQRLVAAKWHPSCVPAETPMCMTESIKEMQNRLTHKLRTFLLSYFEDEVIEYSKIDEDDDKGSIITTRVHPEAMPYAYNQNQIRTKVGSLALKIPELPADARHRMANFSEAFAGHLRADGGVFLPKAVGRDACQEAVKQIFTWAAAGAANMTESVIGPRHRHHLRVPLHEPSLRPALKGILQTVAPGLKSLMSLSARLVELAAFITNPGAPEQYFHPDFNSRNDTTEVAPYYSSFLFLTDVAENGGRLQIIPRTHALSPYREMLSKYAYESSAGKKRAKVIRSAAARAGDVLVYDGTVMHRGSANLADHPRVVLYMTFAGQGAHTTGGTYAIQTELLRQRWTLKRMVKNFTGPSSKNKKLGSHAESEQIEQELDEEDRELRTAMLGHSFTFYRHEFWKMLGPIPSNVKEQLVSFGTSHAPVLREGPWSVHEFENLYFEDPRSALEWQEHYSDQDDSDELMTLLKLLSEASS